MDKSLTDQERVDLRASAIRRIRDIEADLDKSEEIRRYKERGHSHMVAPAQRAWFNEALRDLQRAGENIPDSLIRRPSKIKWKAVKGAPVEDWINGSDLRADIKRMLAEVAPKTD
jgi:hypothetical protein